MFQQQLQALTTKLSKQGVKVTCAESCTGGLLAANLTRLPEVRIGLMSVSSLTATMPKSNCWM